MSLRQTRDNLGFKKPVVPSGRKKLSHRRLAGGGLQEVRGQTDRPQRPPGGPGKDRKGRKEISVPGCEQGTQSVVSAVTPVSRQYGCLLREAQGLSQVRTSSCGMCDFFKQKEVSWRSMTTGDPQPEAPKSADIFLPSPPTVSGDTARGPGHTAVTRLPLEGRRLLRWRLMARLRRASPA